MKIMTEWGEKLDRNHPLQEYPRPQMERSSYLNLNGVWNYAITKTMDTPSAYDGEIVVPFAPECVLSGVEKVVMPDDVLHYEKTFEIPEGFIKDRVLLNFGAVDYKCEVYINGTFCGDHVGGYNPFSMDVTGKVTEGENRIIVKVTDPTDLGPQARGKQSLKHGGIWYTPSSGIWQTVWMESVPENYVQKIRFTPDVDNSEIVVKIIAPKQPKNGLITVKFADKVVAEQTYVVGQDTHIAISDAKLWSPEEPNLYDVVITLDDDEIKSYFGMRKFSVGKDKNGYDRLMLNNKPYFHNGLLDQGCWSDGMYTPASDEALAYDVKLAKEMGFNMLRKHIKVEPLRWYYHCDKLGVLVWQDMINGGGVYNGVTKLLGGGKYNFFTIGVWPFIHVRLDDKKYGRFSRKDKAGRDEYYKDLEEMVDALYNVPSLALWTIFNEGWGQFDSLKVYDFIKKLDPTRTVDPASGWHDQGGKDLLSIHRYWYPFRIKRNKKGQAVVNWVPGHVTEKLSRPVVLSEYGGYSYQEKGHVFSDKIFGYKVYGSKEDLNGGLKKLFEGEVEAAMKNGLAAAVYTQLTDVESEINGLVTYDRKVVKIDRNMLKTINDRLVIEE